MRARFSSVPPEVPVFSLPNLIKESNKEEHVIKGGGGEIWNQNAIETRDAGALQTNTLVSFGDPRVSPLLELHVTMLDG
jgi:hypothetical protein